MTNIPLSLYIHIPWCLQKCPYCDFNSHGIGRSAAIDEAAYVAHLLADLDADLNEALRPDEALPPREAPDAAAGPQQPLPPRPLQSIFIGGGTPSLFSARSIGALLEGIAARLELVPDAEITLEANPSTFEQRKFRDYRAAGVNRLSIGIQSFNDEHLRALGRVHDRDEALRAIQMATAAGFERINLDLMFGLPRQSEAEALRDLATAAAFGLEHLSWYQLTLEPNTAFYRQPPPLPDSDAVQDMFEAGRAYLQSQGFDQYEVSAWTRHRPSAHNLNYWQYGDYLGIGAGAHGKLTRGGQIWRYHKFPSPAQYQRAAGRQPNPYTAREQRIPREEQAFEFMMNGLRLREGVPRRWLAERTLLTPADIAPTWERLTARGLLMADPERFRTSERGFSYLNEVIEHFL